MFQTKVVENMKKHTLWSISFFPPENRAVYEINVEKYCTAGQATETTEWHMRSAYWTPKAANTHRICVLFSTATRVAQTRLSVMMYVQCLSRCFCFASLHGSVRCLPKLRPQKQELWQFSVSQLCSLIYRTRSEACQRPLNYYLQQTQYSTSKPRSALRLFGIDIIKILLRNVQSRSMH